MMSKAELARKAGLSTLTIDRVEAGRPCRLDTKRKILLALGLKVSDKDRLFGPNPDADRPAAPDASSASSPASPSPASPSQGADPVAASSPAWIGPNTGNGESTR